MSEVIEVPVDNEQQEVYEPIVPSITFQLLGDITITWDKDNEQAVKELVRKKMAEGYAFFILAPRKLFGRETSVKTQVKNVGQLEKVDTVTMKSATVDSFSMDVPNPARSGSDGERTVEVKQKGLSVKMDVGDIEVNTLLKEHRISLVTKDDVVRKTEATHRTKDPEEVVKKKSIAVKPIAGG